MTELETLLSLDDVLDMGEVVDAWQEAEAAEYERAKRKR